jgi:hypothetical protein
MNVIRFQIGIVSKKVVPIWVESHGFHHSTYRQPHATDARLPIHLVGIPCYTVEVPHLSILKHWARECWMLKAYIPANALQSANSLGRKARNLEKDQRWPSPVLQFARGLEIREEFMRA